MCDQCQQLQQQCDAFRAAIHDRDIVIDALLHDDTLRTRAQRRKLTVVEKPLSCAFCDGSIEGPSHVDVLLREGEGTLAPGMHPVCEACHVEFVRTQAGGWRR